MSNIKLHDKSFSLFIRQRELQKAIKDVAKKVNDELSGEKPLFLGILNGSFMFASDLFKHFKFDCEISFIKVASYDGTTSTGVVKELIGLSESVKGRTIVIIEDMVDTGNTIENIINTLEKQNPKQIKVATLLLKPEVYKKDIIIDYVAMEVKNDFLVGYGLDYNGLGRNSQNIYKIIN